MSIKRKINLLLSSPFLALIYVYQRFFSIFLPPACIFWPSCSEYSKQALKKHGLILGLYLSIRRLSRCHPFHEGGIDEVPETLHFHRNK
ncbi:membrane protein insertion efficiency factor YidD [bacterium]|nr:membrane protein insertion efficiency factor YidD [bacterium]